MIPESIRTLERRLEKLEQQTIDDNNSGPICFILSRYNLALSDDPCMDILRECGYLSGQPGTFKLVSLHRIPAGLNAAETEEYLRKHGGALCGQRPQ